MQFIRHVYIQRPDLTLSTIHKFKLNQGFSELVLVETFQSCSKMRILVVILAYCGIAVVTECPSTSAVQNKDIKRLGFGELLRPGAKDELRIKFRPRIAVKQHTKMCESSRRSASSSTIVLGLFCRRGYFLFKKPRLSTLFPSKGVIMPFL